MIHHAKCRWSGSWGRIFQSLIQEILVDEVTLVLIQQSSAQWAVHLPSLKPTACPLKTGKLLASPKRKVVSQPSIFRGDWLVLWSVIHLFNTLTVLPLPSWNPMKPAPGCASQMEWPQGEAPQLHLKYLTSDVNWRWFWRQNQWITAKPSDQKLEYQNFIAFQSFNPKKIRIRRKTTPLDSFHQNVQKSGCPHRHLTLMVELRCILHPGALQQCKIYSLTIIPGKTPMILFCSQQGKTAFMVPVVLSILFYVLRNMR